VIPERGSLRGRALGADGLPVEGIRLLQRRAGDKGFNDVDTESPDLDGFRTAQLGRGVIDLLAVSQRAALVPVLQQGVTIGSTPAQVDFLMNRGAQVTLRLADGLQPLRCTLIEEALSQAGVRDFTWSRPQRSLVKDKPVVMRGIGTGRALLIADASIEIEPAVIDVPAGGELDVTVSWKKKPK
jgi:hypothetical protein